MKVHEAALIEFDKIQDAVWDERTQSLNDRRFYSIAGAQWESTYKEYFANKPMLEVNKVHLSVIRIINEYRNNRITVDFISREGKEDDQLADVADGLYRATEQDSAAEEAYDNAFEEAVGGGFGAWRLRAEYEDEEDEDDHRQRILIEPIYDADSSVFFDLDAKRQDKRDAKKCFVLTAMTPDAYREQYKDEPTSWPEEISGYNFDWASHDVVYVAELYVVEGGTQEVFFYETLNEDEERYTEEDFENDPGLEDRLSAVGTREVRSKRIKKSRIHKYTMSGGKILEDNGYVAGPYIPIVPVYGKRWYVDNIERCMGHVRLAKDAQRLKNMQLSKMAEISALSSVEKPILTPEQIDGHKIQWSEDNIKNYPYLLINPMTDQNGNQVPAGPMAYTKVPNIPPALAALLQVTEQDMKDLLGNQEAGEQMVPNISGKTVELIQNRLDMQTFIYMDNMSRAVKRSGEIWLGMARDLFIESGRMMKTVGNQGQVDSIEIAKPVMNVDTGETEYHNDFSNAKYDVSVAVGPSSDSKRQATVRSLIGMLQITPDPETQQVLGAMIMMNMEGEGISEVREYFRTKLVRLGVVEPTEKEQEKLQKEAENAQPDPNTVYLQAAAKNEEAKATKAQADTLKTVAEAEKTEAQTDQILAETIGTLSEIDDEEQRRAAEVAQAISANRPGANQQGE